MPLTASPKPATISLGAERSLHARVLTLLCALWAILFFASLFAPPVLDDADGTHANAARQMLLSGDWVTLRVNNVRYLEKAPLPYWIVAASFRVFGIDAFAAHLPLAIAVLLLMLLGLRWAREALGERAALYTSLGVLTSAGVFLFTRVLIPDVLLSLLLAFGLYCFLKSLPPHPVISTEAQRSGEAIAFASPNDPIALYPYLMWTGLALAVLTKGLVALVFFFGTTAVYLALTGEVRNWRQLKPFRGGLLFLAIAAPWHILAGLRNTGGMNGHGFFWFYFINEHVLRFLGQRIPRDYNKLPGYLYWSLHIVWLFPWALFLPLVFADYRRRIRLVSAQTSRKHLRAGLYWVLLLCVVFLPALFGPNLGLKLDLGLIPIFFWYRHRRYQAPVSTVAATSRRTPGLTFAHRTILLVSVFSALVLIFFSLSTNQEYYTFPAYLPLLMLIAAALVRAEAAYSVNDAEATSFRGWITFAHAAFTILGVAVAAALAYGLWTSRHLAFVPDIGDLLAHRGVGDYTLSMSSLFDLTSPSFAALRLPAFLAMAAFAIGPAVAWSLRAQGRHLAATTSVALTSAAFLIAAHIAFVRFAPMLSSQGLAERIQELEDTGEISRQNTLLLYGDQAYGSSIPFYLNRPMDRPALLVEGRSSSMLFGSTFPDAHGLFLTSSELVAQWGTGGQRRLLFVPLERRNEVDRLLGSRQLVLEETSGKALITDRPLGLDSAGPLNAIHKKGETRTP